MIINNNTKKFEDKTTEIRYLKYVKNKVEVTYYNTNKTYRYNFLNVRVLKNPKKIDVKQKIVLIDGFPISNASLVLDFGEYIKIIDNYKKAEIYHKSKVTYHNSCLNAKRPKTVFNYLKELSSFVCVMDDGKTILLDQYKRITKVREESVLATYLSGTDLNKIEYKDAPIFPFSLNVSQKKAVKTALENSISIIEGPPGTGKTQTILNIIANVVSKGQTVAVVSGNNSAISNVQEKMKKNGYGFITALLGNFNNKVDFFKHRQIGIPDIIDWGIDNKLYSPLIDLEKIFVTW